MAPPCKIRHQQERSHRKPALNIGTASTDKNKMVPLKMSPKKRVCEELDTAWAGWWGITTTTDTKTFTSLLTAATSSTTTTGMELLRTSRKRLVSEAAAGQPARPGS